MMFNLFNNKVNDELTPRIDLVVQTQDFGISFLYLRS